MQRMENDGETHATVALNEVDQAADILARADKNGDGVRRSRSRSCTTLPLE